jgi:hypothetical protein
MTKGVHGRALILAARKALQRPESYSPDFHPEMARKLALLQAEDADIADLFNIAPSTLTLWKSAHPELDEAIKRGRAYADAHIADRMFNRAAGYVATEQQVLRFKDRTYKIIEIKKEYPPDTIAAIFWLKNRQKDRWRDVQDHRHTMEAYNMSAEQRQIEIDRIEAQLLTAAPVDDAEIIELPPDQAEPEQRSV